jgi:hypothetical protein
MVSTKKIIVFILGLFIFLGILNIGINLWLKLKLPEIINKKNDSSYIISYNDINLSLWSSKIVINGISLLPKKNVEKTENKIGIYATISKIEINDFKIGSILFGKKIKAKKITISAPDIVLYKNSQHVINNSKSITSKVIKPFEKVIRVSDIFLIDGKLKIVNNETNHNLASVKNINLNIEGIIVNEETLTQKIPFSYKNYTLVCDSIFYQIDEFYTINSHKIIATDSTFNVQKLELLPKYTRKQFVQKIPKERDLYTIKINEINSKSIKWGFLKDDFYFKTNTILINGLNANIYRGKMPTDDLSKKKLYNRLLRELPFYLKVDSLQLKNSKLVYEEEKTFEEGPGKLIFNDFNMNVLNIQSGFKKTKLSDIKIDIKCNFMEESILDVDWKFNVLDKSDGFTIKGKIFNFNTEQLAYFTKPYINVIIKGTLDKVYFNFSGNDIASKGDFALKYDDLKVEVFRNEKRHKINKFLSAIGNLFIKDDSGETLKTTEIEVKRNQEKSFYNFLWISVAEGLKEILL